MTTQLDNNTDAAVIQSLRDKNVRLFPDLNNGRESVIYGVIKDLKPISRSTKGKKDYFLILALIDPTINKNEKGLTANLFHGSEDAFAKDAAPGDLVIIRIVNVNVYSSYRQVISITGKSRWMVLDCNSFKPKRTPAMEMQLTEEEKAVLKIMQQWYLQSEWHVPRQKAAIQFKPSQYLRRTEEVGQKGCPPYFDFVGMVVTYKPANLMHPGRAELILTDFTPNMKPMIGYEAEGTIDPDMLIQCTLWDENARMCPQLKHGDYIYIRFTRWKTSQKGFLELSVHGESNRSIKIRKIENPNDPNLVAIQRRADDYWSKQKAALGKTGSSVTVDNVYTVLHRQEPITSIQAVLEDDEHVKRFAVRAFIADIKPQNMRDWIRKWCSKCDLVDACDAERCGRCGEMFTKYTLVGSFLIEDTHQQNIILYVYGNDAQHLFSDMGDIRYDDDYVEKFSERLRQLPSSNRPDKLYLDFGIKSYVVPDHGRCFRLDETQFVFC